ncbi:hypothetical protein A5844_001255, partial [Enterococcus sp. 10A9_DIV0425]
EMSEWMMKSKKSLEKFINNIKKHWI